MLTTRIHIVLAAVAICVVAPATAAAQTTIDLEKIRREHEKGSMDDDAHEDGGQTADDAQDEGSSIEIESAGATNSTSFGGQITLEFDERGSSMLVPAEVGGKSVYFLFDTGASFTTLTPSFARSIGASPPDNAPSTVSRTANGSRRFRFGIVPEITLAGRPHRNITYGACKACGGVTYRGKQIVGLLGLNVLRRYRIDYDHSAGEVRLEPGPDFSDRTFDVAPWLDVQRHTPRELDIGDLETAFRVQNRAPRAVEIVLSIVCKYGDGSSETITTGARSIPAGDTEILTARSGRKFCRVQKVDIEDASW